MYKKREANNDQESQSMIDFTNVFTEYYKPLCAYAFQFLKEYNTCEDIVQNTFVKLWKHRSKINFATIKGLLYKMVRLASYDYLTSKKIVTGMDALEYVADNTLINEIIYAETLQVLSEHIKKLPSKRAAIIYQLFIQHKENDEVAKDLGINECTVRKQKQRALEYLKNNLNKIAFIIICAVPNFFYLKFLILYPRIY